MPLHSLKDDEAKASKHEVFGFAPSWTLHNLENIDFDTLTTLAYFDVKVASDGNLITNDVGYQSFKSERATALFKKAHQHGTRVVLTITQMDNADIRVIMDDPQAQQRTIEQTVALVEKRGIDGINVDFEYEGNPGSAYRAAFTTFVKNLTEEMHTRVPGSKVTVSVYASAVVAPKIHELDQLSKYSDGIFMMGYDFAVASSEVAMPTAPLYGHKEGKYWYDISTAVEDFLTVMPADKLILGMPWYGLDFPVNKPEFKAATVGRGSIITAGVTEEKITPDMPNISSFQTGWDELGQINWKAYYYNSQGWRMVYTDDAQSVSKKTAFAKEKQLLGVGMWALGFEGDNKDMWEAIKGQYGVKVADITILNKQIHDNI